MIKFPNWSLIASSKFKKNQEVFKGLEGRERHVAKKKEIQDFWQTDKITREGFLEQVVRSRRGYAKIFFLDSP